MIEMFLSAIPNILTAMFVGSMAGGLVQVCEDDIPKLKKLKAKLSLVMIEREVNEDIQTAFWNSYDKIYNGPKLPSACEEALEAVGSSMQEIKETISPENTYDHRHR
tara:strand:+ start:7147 stop:7467 length:321 start_codon:yes stop_codon:yes gene_type:complete